jgi:large subunit ribosomal protein L4
MPTVDVYNLNRETIGQVDLRDDVFDVKVREHLFHEVVTGQLAARRGGNAKTKERSEVHGSRAKLHRQKGTGRARAGGRQSPIRVGGGVVFGPSPRSYDKKVNKKVRRAALCAALSRRQQEGALVVLDGIKLPEIKTRQVRDILNRFEATKALIIDKSNDHLALSARNLEGSNYLAVEGLNVYDILRHDTLLLTRRAVEAIEGRLGQ